MEAMFTQHSDEPRRQEISARWCIAIIGMNAVGKSSFGKRLASKLHLVRIDTDAVFKKQHGDQQQHIRQHGWEAFRAQEEEIVLASFRPGHVVVLGGGAVESKAVRCALKEKIAVIWLKASAPYVEKYIKAAKRPRPEFAKGTPKEVAKELLAKRDPHYQDIADIIIHEHIPFQQYLPFAIAEVNKYFANDSD